MAYLDTESRLSGKILGSIAIAGALWFLVGRTPLVEWAGRQLMTPAAVELLLLKTGPSAGMLKEMKRSYPKEYEGLLKTYSRAFKSGDDAVAREAEAQRYMTRFLKSHVWQITDAPPAQMAAYVESQLALGEQLRKTDIKACAEVSGKGLSPATYGRLGKAARDLVDASGQALIRLLRASERANTARGAAAPQIQLEDGLRLRRALVAQGMTARQMQIASVPWIAQSATADELCAVNSLYWRAIKALPANVAVRVTGTTIKESLASLPD
jgi:hypothetical protein